MPRTPVCLCLIATLTVIASAQPAPSVPKFLMADVHTVPPQQNPLMRAGLYKSGRYEVHNATMADLVRTAYGVDPDKVLGLPPAAARTFFEIYATTPPDSNPDSLKLMLQSLLAERFALIAHRDTKPIPAYVLTAAPKPLLKEADGTGETGCKIQSNDASETPVAARPGVNIVRANINGTSVQLDMNKPFPFACRNMTMAALAEGLRGLLGAPQYLGNTPVVDQTELKGTWNFDLSYTFRQGPQAPAPADAVSLFAAFDKLGLKLELGKAPFPVVVVDSVNATPTANLPGVTEKMAPPPARFEVADLKPGIPVPNTGSGGGGTGGIYMPSPGRVTFQGQSLKSLIATAWNLNNADSVIGGPTSLENAKFDVDALMPTPELVPGSGPAMGQVDMDGIRQMLRTLLQERFRLTLHEEQRPVPVAELTVSNPALLKKADPAATTGCVEGPGADGKDPRTANPVAARLVTCLNMTIGEFAAQLKNRASGYLAQSPVPVDATKLDGRFDFTLNFSGAGVNAPGAITLSEALDKQLGLKLGTGSHPGAAMVIDHCEEKPIE